MPPNPQSANGTALERVCAALRGERDVTPIATGAADTDDLWTLIEAHGIGPLLFDALSRTGALENWPAPIPDRLRRLAREQAALEMLRREELVAMLEALAAVGVDVLLMKGTPLAYTLYRSPEQRVRDDTDALIEHRRLDSAVDALTGLDYRRSPSIDGELVMQQLQMSRVDRFGAHHVLDLHWKVSNPHLFAGALDFEELFSEAVEVPALGPHARALGDTHALLLACIHRVAHHGASDRLIWLYDIHLLLEHMDAAERARFSRTAAEKDMAQVCADGIALAGARFHTRGAGALAAELLELGTAGGGERSARYLRGHRTGAALLWDDLQALPGWRQRLRLLREHALPSRAYMHSRFGARPGWQLPWFYVRRGLGGLARLLKPRRSP
jgi:hypothetical protein